ncbi:MAG: hypothetical protein IJ099_00635 [Alphaproteobacteria bacterium]|nr:hypothetical protein [Alphaproteobacteria bacterium]
MQFFYNYKKILVLMMWAEWYEPIGEHFIKYLYAYTEDDELYVSFSENEFKRWQSCRLFFAVEFFNFVFTFNFYNETNYGNEV